MNEPAMVSRRQLLAAGALSAATAGCLDAPGNVSSGDGNPTGMAAFFPLLDWASQVGGDVIEFSAPVRIGEMGHGWEPDGTIVPEIAQHDVFVYLGTPEFQWAVDTADELAGSGHDVQLIDGLSVLPQEALLPFAQPETSPDASTVPEEVSELTIHEFEIIVGDEPAARYHDDHWDGGLPAIPRGGTLPLRFAIRDEAGTRIDPADVDQLTVTARSPEDAPSDVVGVDTEPESVTVSGETTGESRITFEVRLDGAVAFDTTADPLSVTVTDPEGDVKADTFHDPHVWVDPIHARSIVGYLAEEFAEIAPAHADTFNANAAAYTERLEAVDRQFRQLMDDAEREVAVFAGHNAFQYLEARYGFELVTPVGASADAAESIEDVAGLREAIERHDIDTMLFDPFDAPHPDEDLPRTVRVLLEETDATQAAPLTAAEGLTPTWEDAGYGWVEQMTEVNLPSLEQALGTR